MTIGIPFMIHGRLLKRQNAKAALYIKFRPNEKYKKIKKAKFYIMKSYTQKLNSIN